MTYPQSSQDAALCIRPIRIHDLPAIDHIQRQCYQPELHEPLESFAARIHLSPDSSWLAEHQGEVLGYFFTHPWVGDKPPALGEALQHLPPQADTHYLHDLAVLPQARGRGVAPTLIQTALGWGKTRGLAKTRLVAIAGAQPFWQRWGFRKLAAAPDYGDQAAIMSLTEYPGG